MNKLDELADALQELLERDDLTMAEREMEERILGARITAARVFDEITAEEAAGLYRGLEEGKLKP